MIDDDDRTPLTIAQALHVATRRLAPIAGDDARLESEVLLAHVLRAGRAHLLARLQDDLRPDVSAQIEALLARRLAREPLAYITGRREFYGIEFECTPAALIPRPETELLVELALEDLRARHAGARLADIGTGSGAIAIALAAHAPGARITAIDASPAALALARRNAARAGVTEHINFRAGDLLDGGDVFDVIVANLPYVRESDWRQLPPEIRDHEPREALVGGVEGTETIERLLAIAPAHLTADGLLAAEIGADQRDRVLAAARACFPAATVCVIKDLAALDRVLVVRNGGG